MVQADLPGPRCLGQAAGVLGARVPRVGKPGQLFRRVLRVVDQNVNTGGEFKRSFVQFSDTGRAWSESKRVVIGEVRDGAGTVAHPESECTAPLVRDLFSNNQESLERVLTLFHCIEAPAVAKRAGLDREVWRRKRAR